MHEIKINYGSGRHMHRSLPSSWQEVPHRQRWELLRAVVAGESLRVLTSQLLSLPSMIETHITTAQWHDLTRSMAWLHADLPLEEPLLHYICPRKVALYMPAAHFTNVTGREMALIDDMFMKEDQQDRILATLCRPAPRPGLLSPAINLLIKGREHISPRADRRIPLTDGDQVDAWLPEIQAIPQEIRTYLHAVFSGWKLRFYETYREWLFTPPSGPSSGDADKDEPQEQQHSGLDFGWWGAYMSIAEDGVLGTYEQVLDAPIHTICMHLVRKREEYLHLQEEQDHAVARARMK